MTEGILAYLRPAMPLPSSTVINALPTRHLLRPLGHVSCFHRLLSLPHCYTCRWDTPTPPSHRCPPPLSSAFTLPSPEDRASPFPGGGQAHASPSAPRGGQAHPSFPAPEGGKHTSPCHPYRSRSGESCLHPAPGEAKSLSSSPAPSTPRHSPQKGPCPRLPSLPGRDQANASPPAPDGAKPMPPVRLQEGPSLCLPSSSKVRPCPRLPFSSQRSCLRLVSHSVGPSQRLGSRSGTPRPTPSISLELSRPGLLHTRTHTLARTHSLSPA